MSNNDALDDLLTNPYLETSEAWETRGVQRLLSDVTADWLSTWSEWKTFITLTFRDPEESDVVKRYFRRFVQILNRDAFGDRYIRKVGHSYFSYILATEYQKRGAIHLHSLADRGINFLLAHSCWNRMAGFAYIEPVKSQEEVVRYCSKYLIKRGDLEFYRSNTWRLPPLGKWNL